MKVIRTASGEIFIYTLEGELDQRGGTALVARVIEDARRYRMRGVILNAEAIHFVSTRELSYLHELQSRLDQYGRVLALYNVHRQIRALIQRIGLDKLMIIAPNRHAAETAIRRVT